MKIAGILLVLLACFSPCFGQGTVATGYVQVNGQTKAMAQYWLLDVEGQKVWVGVSHAQDRFKGAVRIGSCTVGYLGSSSPQKNDFFPISFSDGYKVQLTADVRYYSPCGSQYNWKAFRLSTQKLEGKRILILNNSNHSPDIFTKFSNYAWIATTEVVREGESGSPVVLDDNKEEVIGMLVGKNTSTTKMLVRFEPGTDMATSHKKEIDSVLTEEASKIVVGEYKPAVIIPAREILRGLYENKLGSKEPDPFPVELSANYGIDTTPDVTPSSSALIRRMLAVAKRRKETYLELSTDIAERSQSMPNFDPEKFSYFQLNLKPLDDIKAKRYRAISKVSTGSEIFLDGKKWQDNRQANAGFKISSATLYDYMQLFDLQVTNGQDNDSAVKPTVWGEPVRLEGMEGYEIPFTKVGYGLANSTLLATKEKVFYATIAGSVTVSAMGDIKSFWFRASKIPKGSYFSFYALKQEFDYKKIAGEEELVPVGVTIIYNVKAAVYVLPSLVRVDITNHTLPVTDTFYRSEDAEVQIKVPLKLKVK